MSPQRKGSKRGSGWKPPRDRREIVTAVLAALAVVVVTAALIWLVRPNRDSGSTTSETPITTPVTTPTTVTPAPTTAPTDNTVAPTDGTVAPSTP